MKFGMVMPFYAPTPQRVAWAERSFASLGKTNLAGLESPLLYVVHKGKSHQWPAFGALPFIVRFYEQPQDAKNLDGALAWGWNRLVEENPEISHLLMLTDDYLYNPDWLIALEGLILRRPEARAWWVYRSAHEYHHKVFRIDGEDALVRSISGNGCFTVEEWKAWGVDYREWPREFGNPEGGNTLDLHHSFVRPGEYWLTKRSYIQNIGTRGVHQRKDTPERAVDFVGE
jgi:hypothetical protein